MAGDVPPPLADEVGMTMFIGPMLRSWWTATHQVHTSPCIGPATYPIMRLSLLVHTMDSRPLEKLQNTRPAAWSSFTMPMVIWSTVYLVVCWYRWFQPTSP